MSTKTVDGDKVLAVTLAFLSSAYIRMSCWIRRWPLLAIVPLYASMYLKLNSWQVT